MGSAEFPPAGEHRHHGHLPDDDLMKFSRSHRPYPDDPVSGEGRRLRQYGPRIPIALARKSSMLMAFHANLALKQTPPLPHIGCDKSGMLVIGIQDVRRSPIRLRSLRRKANVCRHSPERKGSVHMNDKTYGYGSGMSASYTTTQGARARMLNAIWQPVLRSAHTPAP